MTMAAAANGHSAASTKDAASMAQVFPEALRSLKEADPEIYGIIQDEKARQWCVLRARLRGQQPGLR
jgi:hypothetical protein